MGVLRVFSLYQDFGCDANNDVDQFFPFWRVTNYFDEDFVFRQRPAETTKDCEAFLQSKYQKRKEKDPSYVCPKLMRLESKENSAGAAQGNPGAPSSKSSASTRGAIANIDWSLDSKRIVVCFKMSCMIVVWDTVTCERIFQLEFSAKKSEQVAVDDP